jgi:hypothetical protein
MVSTSTAARRDKVVVPGNINNSESLAGEIVPAANHLARNS